MINRRITQPSFIDCADFICQSDLKNKFHQRFGGLYENFINCRFINYDLHRRGSTSGLSTD